MAQLPLSKIPPSLRADLHAIGYLMPFSCIKLECASFGRSFGEEEGEPIC